MNFYLMSHLLCLPSVTSESRLFDLKGCSKPVLEGESVVASFVFGPMHARVSCNQCSGGS